MTQAEIQHVQQQLQAAGYNPGPIDGILGPQTQTAIRNYQASRGLAVDGVAGPMTMKALESNAPPVSNTGQAPATGARPPAPTTGAHINPNILNVATGGGTGTTAPPATSPSSQTESNFANAVLGATGQPGQVSVNANDSQLTAFLQPYLNIPDLANLLQQASDPASGGPWDQTRFEAAIMSTPWWQNNSEQARAWQVLPPGQQQALINEYAAQVWDSFNQSYGRGWMQQNSDYTNQNSPAINYYAQQIASGAMTLQQMQADIRQSAQLDPNSQANKNQVAQVKNIIQTWGMGDSVNDVIQQGVSQGLSNDQIVQNIRGSQAYAAAFPGQALRQANGLSYLDENQYRSLISSYQQAMREFGVNPSSLDANSLGQLIGNDISGTELNERLGYMNTVATTFGPTMRAAFEQHAGLKVDDADLYAMFNGTNPQLAQAYAQATGTNPLSSQALGSALDQVHTNATAPPATTGVQTPTGSTLLSDLQVIGPGSVTDASLKNALDKTTEDEKAMFHQLSREANEPALISAVPKGTF